MPVYTDLPTEDHFGELQLARKLIDLGDPKMHLWFNVSWIPGVGEIDLIIWHEQVGLFVCGTKAVRLSDIREISTNRIWLSYQERATKSPQAMTLQKVYELQNQIRGRMVGKLPFITPALIWPRIASAEWKAAFTDDVADMADSMLFADDISSSITSFLSGLRRVAERPIIGKSIGPRPLDDAAVRRAFEHSIESRSQKPIVKPSELERIQLLELKAAQQVLPDVPVDVKSKVLYRGAPGTGKTFRLLQLAVNHCRAKRNVLYLCYNKTLAADIKRLFTLEPAVQTAENFPWAFDVTDLLRYVARYASIELPQIEGSAREWFELLRDDVASTTAPLAIFDLVLVDEVQDMEDWMLEFGSLFLSEGGSIVLAEGQGQQFYGTRGDWLSNFEANSKLVQLRRNFRNTAQVYSFATIMANWAREGIGLKSELKVSDDVTFDRRDGSPPTIAIIESRVNLDGIPRNPVIAFDMQMVSEYRKLIAIELESLFKEHDSRDLLILVPQDSSKERTWAVEALEELRVPFLDYTSTRNNTSSWKPFMDNRRVAGSNDMVRLCTYRSSRGLEAARVLLFGLERVMEIADEIRSRPDSLLHVILSRAVYENTIAWPSEHKSTLKEAIDNAFIFSSRARGR